MSVTNPQPMIAGIGELLWDVLPGTEALGGAPVNFAYHVKALGGNGVPISTIGRDERGVKALAVLKEHGLDTSAITVQGDYATGYVIALVDSAGVASYSFPEEVAWDHLQINTHAEALSATLDAICFGTLAQRSVLSHQVIMSYIAALPRHTLRVFDVNLRQHFYSREILLSSLMHADIVKLNDEELPIMAELLGISGDSQTVLATVVKDYSLQLAIYTRGGQGSLLMTDKEISHHSGVSTTVVDTIGAGDSFTAAATLGYLQGRALDDINNHANLVAAYVCSQRGAMVPVPHALQL